MKIYCLTPNDTSLVNPDTRLLEQVKGELFRHPNVLPANGPDQADAIVLQEGFAFREWRYVDRLLSDPIVGRLPHRTYTINYDDAATGLLRGTYTCLPQRLFNPQLHAIVPFSQSPNELVYQLAHNPRPAPTFLATWRGNPKSNRKVRSRLVALFGQSPNFRVEATDSWLNHGPDEKRQYVDLVRSGKFSLCPGGNAPATFRVFESMMLGVAPVIIADQVVLPRGPEWERIAIRIPETQLANLEAFLTPFADRYQEMGALAREAWETYFTPDNMMRYWADRLLDSIVASAGIGSRNLEIKRWRSFHTYWNNRWTLPQRVQIKVEHLVSKATQ